VESWLKSILKDEKLFFFYKEKFIWCLFFFGGFLKKKSVNIRFNMKEEQGIVSVKVAFVTMR
jgi:hypothetical protein